jgi:hypothetical protein
MSPLAGPVFDAVVMLIIFYPWNHNEVIDDKCGKLVNQVKS